MQNFGQRVFNRFLESNSIDARGKRFSSLVNSIIIVIFTTVMFLALVETRIQKSIGRA